MSENIEENKYVQAEISVTEHSYPMLGSIVSNQIEKGKTEEAGYKFRWFIPAMAFSVFQLESVTNSFGYSLFDHWEDYESLPIKNKVRIISDRLNIDVQNFSVEPWQIIHSMVKFRNDLVHLKPKRIIETQTLRKMENGKLLGALYPNTKEKRSPVHKYSLEEAEKFKFAVDCIQRIWSHACCQLNPPKHPLYTQMLTITEK